MIRISILIDALGWETAANSSFLKDLLPVRSPLRTVLGYSSAAIPTILTGRLPQDHGMWNLLYRSERGSPFAWTRMIAPFPAWIAESRALRYAVRHISKTMSGYRGYFSCYRVPVRDLRHYDICEKENIYNPGGVPGTPTLFDELVESKIPYRAFSYHDGDDARVLDLAGKALVEKKVRVLFLYLAEIDALLHRAIEDGDRVGRRLEWYEAQVRNLYRTAVTHHGDVELQVFSDHGMTPTRETVDVMSLIDALGCRAGRDYLALYDSTMARFWFFTEHGRRAVTETLHREEGGRILEEDELRREGIYFPDGRYGELIFLMNPGVLITPSHMGAARIPGMHGYHPDEPTCEAAFLSNREPEAAPRHIADLKKTVLEGIVG